MVFAMSKSNLVAFRIPSELQDEFNRSVLASGGDKTSWLVDAIRMKLGQPEKSIDSRMLGLVERGKSRCVAYCRKAEHPTKAI